MAKVNGYELSRKWFDFAFESKEAKCIHTAIYMWAIELNNRLGWKSEFGFPTKDTMEGLSIGNKRTYLDALQDLINWGFIKIVQESKNQYCANYITICHSKNEPALHTALHTAVGQNRTSTATSTAPIDKQYKQYKTNNTENTNHPLVNYFGYDVNLKMPDTITDLDEKKRWVVQHCRKAYRDLCNLENSPYVWTEEDMRGRWNFFYNQDTLEFKYHLRPQTLNLPEE